MSPNQHKDPVRGTVADFEKNYFGRKPSHQAHVMKVGILREDCESFFRCISPHLFIGRAIQPGLRDMGGTGKKIFNQ